jgi:hypothetical protein
MAGHRRELCEGSPSWHGRARRQRGRGPHKRGSTRSSLCPWTRWVFRCASLSRRVLSRIAHRFMR